jgi:hypothetical protein
MEQQLPSIELEVYLDIRLHFELLRFYKEASEDALATLKFNLRETIELVEGWASPHSREAINNEYGRFLSANLEEMLEPRVLRFREFIFENIPASALEQTIDDTKKALFLTKRATLYKLFIDQFDQMRQESSDSTIECVS